MTTFVKLKFTLNGKPQSVSVPPMKRLLDVLRDECRMTGTKEGCGEGECGACTVLLGGDPVNACLVPAIHADGATIVTVEGLARNGKLSRLQQAFVDMGGAQCGMCTPGMLVTSAALLARTKGRVPSDPEVREALSGTLCRCTGYQKIVDAVRAAAAPAAGKPAVKRASPKAASRKAARKQPVAKKRPAAKKAAKKAAKPRAPRKVAKPAVRKKAAKAKGRRS